MLKSINDVRTLASGFSIKGYGDLEGKVGFQSSHLHPIQLLHRLTMQFSIFVLFAAFAALVYGIPTHNDHIGRALMRRANCDWNRV